MITIRQFCCQADYIDVMSDQITNKRISSSLNLLEGIQAIILDIEGTTTPITFVKDILFGYVREHLEDYLDKQWNEEECKDDVKTLRDQSILDKEIEGVVSIPEEEPGDPRSSTLVKRAVVESIRWLMAADRKVTALKQFQGHMWQSGYEEKKLVGEIFSDVLPAIKLWVAEGKKVYVYSSGSVEAQKLLFGHTKHGSLLELFSGNFDTRIGPKVEKTSYEKIAKEVGCDPPKILFLTDVTREALPASQTGFKTTIVVRDGNAPLTEDEAKSFPQITSFSELLPDEEPPKKLQKR